MSPQLKAMADGLIVAVKGFVARAEAALGTRIEAIEKRFESIPGDIQDAVAKAVAQIPKPENGKDADAAVIIRAAADAVAAIPKPADGKSITLEEVRPVIAEMVKSAVAEIPKPRDVDDEAVVRAVLAQVAPQLPTLPDIPALVREAVGQLPKPKDGNDADPAEIERAVAAAVEKLPKPQDGKSVTAEELQPMLAALAAKAVADLPRPRDGQDAKPEAIEAAVRQAVAALPAPKDGTSVTVEDVAPLIDESVKKAVSALPAPAAGKDADPELVKSLVAQAAAALPKPEDGKSITPEDMVPVLETVVAKWALDFERRAADVLQRAVERLPAPKDGRDAFELEDLQAEHDGDGNVTLRFVRGELRREFAVRLPRFKDCGVFSAGIEYRSGDGVTWGGSFFIAQKDAPAGKPGESDDWRLAVKRGRDGKDVKPPEPPRGPIKVG